MAAREERRKSRRLFIDKPVGIAVISGPFAFLTTRPKIEGRIRDASTSGFQFISTHELRAGSKIKVWLQVQPGAHMLTLVLRGDVQWCELRSNGEEFKAGIKLHPKPAKAMNTWIHVMHEHLRRNES